MQNAKTVKKLKTDKPAPHKTEMRVKKRGVAESSENENLPGEGGWNG